MVAREVLAAAEPASRPASRPDMLMKDSLEILFRERALFNGVKIYIYRWKGLELLTTCNYIHGSLETIFRDTFYTYLYHLGDTHQILISNAPQF